MRRVRAIALVLVASAGGLAADTAASWRECLDRTATLVGTPGRDVLRGTPGGDVIVALGGSDVVEGGSGDDVVCGGPGADRLLGGGGSDLLAGGRGADTLDGGAGADRLLGGRGEDACFPGTEGGTRASCAPLVAAAGDIACDPSSPPFPGTGAECHMKGTSDLLVGGGLSAVLTLGDAQYEDGALSKFQASYHPTWGRVKEITRPAVGSHEYLTPGASGHFAYFGKAAGDPSRGYYGFDLGRWRLLALNSNCGAVGGCGPGSPQETWLRGDLAAHPAACTLGYWHHARFSSGAVHGSDPATAPLWGALHEAGADVVLAAHDHHYERFAPQDADGLADPERGIREFVVGTGGRGLRGLGPVAPNSRVRHAGTFGVLELALLADGYVWRFVPEGGVGFTDAGRAKCH